jgi:hypothetical protein
MAGEENYEKMKAAVMDTLAGHFRPEFLNRIDEIVVFHPLAAAQLRRIVQIQLGYLRRRLGERDMGLEVSEQALDLIAEAGYDPVYGARPLKRAIQGRIENPLAQAILKGNLRPGETIEVDVQDGDLVFRSKSRGRVSYVERLQPRPNRETTRCQSRISMQKLRAIFDALQSSQAADRRRVWQAELGSSFPPRVPGRARGSRNHHHAGRAQLDGHASYSRRSGHSHGPHAHARRRGGCGSGGTATARNEPCRSTSTSARVRHDFEALQKISRAAAGCLECGALRLKKLVRNPFRLKGTG